MGPAKGKEAAKMKNPDTIQGLLGWWPDSSFWNPNSGFPTAVGSAFEKAAGPTGLWVCSPGKPEKGRSSARPTAGLRRGVCSDVPAVGVAGWEVRQQQRAPREGTADRTSKP